MTVQLIVLAMTKADSDLTIDYLAINESFDETVSNDEFVRQCRLLMALYVDKYRIRFVKRPLAVLKMHKSKQEIS